MLISLSGEKQVGKDVFADRLCLKYGFVKISFAKKLKQICADVFRIPQPYFDDPIMKERVLFVPILITTDHLRELAEYFPNATTAQLDKMADVGFDHVCHTIRELLQFVGTDIIRNCLDEDAWISFLKPRMDHLKTFGRLVCTDARFPNERSFFKSLGGINIRIKRPQKSKETHASETSLGNDEDYHYIINNNKDLNNFEQEIDTLMLYLEKQHDLG